MGCVFSIKYRKIYILHSLRMNLCGRESFVDVDVECEFNV